jgi:uncharacterized membrane protein
MNSCFVSSFVTFFMFSKSVLRLICILLVSFVVSFVLEGQTKMNLKIAGVDRWRFRVFYGASIVLEVFLGQTGQTVR